MASFFAFLTFDNFLFLVGLIGFFSVLITWHLSSLNDLDLKTIILKDGEISLSKLGQLIALLVSTWIIIYQTRNNLLTEWLFSGYMIAWSGANLISKWIERGNTPGIPGSSNRPDGPTYPRYGRDQSIMVPRNDKDS